MNLSFEAEAIARRARELAEKKGHLLCVGEHLAHALISGRAPSLEPLLRGLPRERLLHELEARLARLPSVPCGLPVVWSADLDRLKTAAEQLSLLGDRSSV